MQNIQKDHKLMEILDLKEISRMICNTDKSYLTLKLRKGEQQYWLYLDSVPLSKSDNKECMDLLFPPKIEIQQVNKSANGRFLSAKILYDGTGSSLFTHPVVSITDGTQPVTQAKKKGGRPKGSKNK